MIGIKSTHPAFRNAVKWFIFDGPGAVLDQNAVLIWVAVEKEFHLKMQWDNHRIYPESVLFENEKYAIMFLMKWSS